MYFAVVYMATDNSSTDTDVICADFSTAHDSNYKLYSRDKTKRISSEETSGTIGAMRVVIYNLGTASFESRVAGSRIRRVGTTGVEVVHNHGGGVVLSRCAGKYLPLSPWYAPPCRWTQATK